MKVFFYGLAGFVNTLKEKYSSLLPGNAYIEFVGKSEAISIQVSKVDPLSVSFSDQQDEVKHALQNLSPLEILVSKNGGYLKINNIPPDGRKKIINKSSPVK